MNDFTAKAVWAFVQMIGTTVVLRLSDNAFDGLSAWIQATTGIPMGWFQ